MPIETELKLRIMPDAPTPPTATSVAVAPL